MAGSSLTKETARVSYKMMICPAIEYPLTVTQFTQDQCNRITSPILRSSMSQMGYNRNSRKEVVYGPLELGGFGFHDLFIEQGIQQVTALVGNLREDLYGCLMKIEMDWCHVQALATIFSKNLALTSITSRHVGLCLFVISCSCMMCAWSSRNTLAQ